MRTYNILFSGTSKHNTDEGIDISRSDYNNGYALTLYAFDLTSDLSNDDDFNLVWHKSVRLALRFSTLLPTTGQWLLTLLSWIAIAMCWSTSEYEYRRDTTHSVQRRLTMSTAAITTAWPDDVQLGLVASSGHSLDCNVHCPIQKTGRILRLDGKPPCMTVRKYLDRWCKRWTYNDRQLQSVISTLCGHYCIYYCLLRNRKITMREIVDSLSKDTAFNDALIDAFACRHSS